MADQNQQNQAAQNAEAQRRADEQRRAAQQQGGQGGQQSQQQRTGQQGQQAQQDNLQQARRQAFDNEKRMVAERPQQVGDEGQKPTPTQQENDELRNGLRHLDDKEDDGSGPDFVHNRVVRRADDGNQQQGEAKRRQVESNQAGKYETR